MVTLCPFLSLEEPQLLWCSLGSKSQESFPNKSFSRQGMRSSPCLNHHHSLTSAFFPPSVRGLTCLVTGQETGQDIGHRAKHSLRKTRSRRVPLRSPLVLQAPARPALCPHHVHVHDPLYRETWRGGQTDRKTLKPDWLNQCCLFLQEAAPVAGTRRAHAVADLRWTGGEAGWTTAMWWTSCTQHTTHLMVTLSPSGRERSATQNYEIWDGGFGKRQKLIYSAGYGTVGVILKGWASSDSLPPPRDGAHPKPWAQSCVQTRGKFELGLVLWS